MWTRVSALLGALAACVALPLAPVEGKTVSGRVVLLDVSPSVAELEGTTIVNRRGEYLLLANGKYLRLMLQGASNFEDALWKASVQGKYGKLLDLIKVPQDKASYGEFYDWGLWTGTSWAGYHNLPQGHWVYVAPYWFIWGEPRSQKANPSEDYADLLGKKVMVTGTEETQFNVDGVFQREVIHLTRLQAAEKHFVKRTVHIEVKGKLERVPDDSYIRLPIDVLKGKPIDLAIQRLKWVVTANGQVYTLDFGGNQELLALAQKLEGQTVILSGIHETRQTHLYFDWPEPRVPARLLIERPMSTAPVTEEVIKVQSLKPAHTGHIKQIVLVEMKGKLTYTGGITIEQTPEGVNGYLEIDGQSHPLDFGNDKLAYRAKQMHGRTVIVTGKFVDRPDFFGRMHPVLVVEKLQFIA